jgi:putative lipoprotein
MYRMRFLHTVGLSTLMLLGSMSSSFSAELAKVSGTLTTRQKTALPANAVIYISLTDVSPREDNLEEMVARKTISHPSQMPVSFELEYDPSRISSSHIYAIQVRITADHRPLFSNASAYLVITQGNPQTVAVVVDPVP